MSSQIAIISDTHGLLRPEVLQRLDGVAAILHAGDINKPDVLDTLAQYAPVHVVRGNNDKEWAEHIPHDLAVTVAGIRFYMVHSKRDIPVPMPDADVIVFGHSHKYAEFEVKGRLFLNPGSCGKRRFDQEITFAVMTVADDGAFSVEKITIPHA